MSDCPVDVTVIDGAWCSVDWSIDLVNVFAFFDKVEYVGGEEPGALLSARNQ